MRRVTHLLFDANLTGGQIFALRLGEALRQEGWESDYVLPGEGPLVALLEESGFAWHVVPMDGNPLPTAMRLRRHLRRNPPDVVHTHLVLPTQFAARLAAKSLRIPLVAHYHTSPTLPRGHLRSAVYRLIERIGANRLTGANVAVSDALARSLIPLGIRRLIVVPNGVVIPGATLPHPEGRTILVLGRIARAKGQDIAIRALAMLPKCMAARCRIVGEALTPDDQDFLDSLPPLSCQLAVGESVEILSATDAPQQHFEEAWCLALPSRSGEGMPLVILEAMAIGVPVVAACLAGVPEIVEDGVTGLLFEPEDPGGLASALERLDGDPALAKSIVTNARAKAEASFSIQVASNRVAGIYRHIADLRFGSHDKTAFSPGALPNDTTAGPHQDRVYG